MDDRIVVHLAQKNCEELAVAGEVFPSDGAIVPDCLLGLVPDLDQKTVEEIVLGSVEQHGSPVWNFVDQFLYISECLFELFSIFDSVENGGFPVVDH